MPVNAEIFSIYRHLFYGSPLKMVNSQNTAENLESLLNDWGNRPLIPPDASHPS